MLMLRAGLIAALTLASASLVLGQQTPAGDAPAAQEKPAELKPVAVISLAGYEALRNDVDYVLELAGQPEMAGMIDATIAGMTGGQGLAGLDTTRPVAVVLQGDGQQLSPLAFIPVDNQEQFLGLLMPFLPDQQELEPGLYQLRGAVGVDLFLRVKEGWAYAGMQQSAVQGALPDPDQLITDIAKEYDLAVTFKLADLPEPYKQLILAQLQQSVAVAAERQPGETDAEYEGRQFGAQLVADCVTQLFEEGQEITLGLRISRDQKNVVLDFSLTGRSGSQLAAELGKLADAKTEFGALVEQDAPLSFVMTIPLGKSAKKVSHSLFAQIKKEALAELANRPTLETEAERKKAQELAGRFIDIVDASLQTGRTDAVVSMRGEAPGPFTVFGAGYVAGAGELDSLLREAADLLAKSPDIDGVELDVATYKGVKIHAVQVALVDPEPKKLFGETAKLHLGFGEVEFYFCFGRDSLEGVKSAIDAAGTDAAGGKLPAMLFQMSFGPWMDLGAGAEEDPYTAMARESFTSEDYGRFVVESIPDGVRLRIEYSEGLLRFIGRAAAMGAQGAMQPPPGGPQP